MASSSSKECAIRPAHSKEEVHALWWPFMQHLGWNRSSQDIQTHYPAATAHLGPSGWLHVCPKDAPDEGVGCIVPFIFDNGTGWVGFFCVKEEFQGRGWGAALFKKALETFEKAGTRMVGLDAVEAQVGTYERRGFKATDRVKLMVRKSVAEKVLGGGFEHVETDGERLVPLEDVPSDVLVKNDLDITGFQRGKTWSKQALFESRDDAWGLALVSHHTKDTLDGWILVRSCEEGFRIGPLYANDRKEAAFLLHQALYRLQDKPGSFIAEVWGSNAEAVDVFEEAGWEYSGMDYHRMWLGGRVPEQQQKGGKAEREMWAVFDAGQS